MMVTKGFGAIFGNFLCGDCGGTKTICAALFRNGDKANLTCAFCVCGTLLLREIVE